MPQEVQMLAFCFFTVALSIAVTLLCLNEKGNVIVTFHFRCYALVAVLLA